MVAERQGRRYDASGRRAQALQTRERILERARELFISRGFGGTSVADVAAAAEVSVPTVFNAFGSKVRLLKEAAETTLVGDAHPIPMAERAEMRQVQAAGTAEEILDRFAALVASRAPAVHPIYAVVSRGRDLHPEVAELAEELDDQRLSAATRIAALMADRLDRAKDEPLVSDLRDCIWAALAVENYEALVVRRGWSIDRYRQWVRDAMAYPLRRGPEPLIISSRP